MWYLWCGAGKCYAFFVVECSRLKEFHEFLKGLLEKHWGGNIFEGVERRFFLFGLKGKSKVLNINLLNYVLIHARYAIRLRRDLGHYEGKIVSVEAILWTFWRKMWSWYINMAEETLKKRLWGEVLWLEHCLMVNLCSIIKWFHCLIGGCLEI